ncbi:MAG: DUF1015 domain-containing protein [Streptosporangiales bacterium]|nr:DUF1015 domain-containing protein [Streptosporangiales bacterium]
MSSSSRSAPEQDARRNDGAGLELRPFRAVRYAPDEVRLDAVTSPPYDLIDPDEADRLERREAHNVVRLVLPDPAATARSQRYRRAARLLQEWLASGPLRRDAAPALYVYEERDADGVHRGLLGAVGLRAPEQRIVLPHEDVHPVPVADRVAQMRATNANLEPIYLLVPDTGDAASVVDAVAEHEPPLAEVRAEAGVGDGAHVGYRLWAVTDERRLATVAAALAPCEALIADGHHRYAAYRAIQDGHHTDGDGPGPWDYGLALVVDAAAYPPTLRPIHRVLRDVPVPVFLAGLPDTAEVRSAGRDLADAVSLLDGRRAGGQHRFVLGGGERFLLVTLDRDAVGVHLPGGRSAAWRDLDVTALHHGILDPLLHVPDDDVTFVHAAEPAVRMAQRSGGTAVLLAAPTVEDVHAIAAAGERMPRKSTSFGPKPRNGFVLRLLD